MKNIPAGAIMIGITIFIIGSILLFQLIGFIVCVGCLIVCLLYEWREYILQSKVRDRYLEDLSNNSEGASNTVK